MQQQAFPAVAEGCVSPSSASLLWQQHASVFPRAENPFSEGYSSCFQEDLEYAGHIPVDPLVSLQCLRDGHCSTALICYMPAAVLPNCTDPLVAVTDRSHRAAFCDLHSANPHSLTTNPHIQSKHTPEIRT